MKTTDTLTPKPRLQYFDMLKGMAIFMVVMGHVITFGIRGLDRAFIFKLIAEVHMPLFFFISGWFSLKILAPGKWKCPDLLSRAKQLLLPMVVMSTLWLFYFPHSGLKTPFSCTFYDMWHSAGKFGYWFTYVLFELMLIYALVRPLFSKLKHIAAQMLVLLAIWIVMLVVLNLTPESTAELLSLNPMVQYFPVFMFGVLAHQHSDAFHRLTESNTVLTFALPIAAILLYYISWNWEFPEISDAIPMPTHIARTLLHAALAIIAIALVRPWGQQAFDANRTKPARFASMWAYIGRESLAIYLLHYFFLFPFTPMRSLMNALNVGFVPMLVNAAFWAAAIIAVTLGVYKVICLSKPLALLMTGKIK